MRPSGSRSSGNGCRRSSTCSRPHDRAVRSSTRRGAPTWRSASATASATPSGSLPTRPHVFSETFRVQRYAGVPLETRGVVAQWDRRDGTLTTWNSTQVSHFVQQGLAGALELPPHRIRVIAPDLGGGFGTKASGYAEDLLVPAAAMVLGRPVKWIESRREHMWARPTLAIRRTRSAWPRGATARSSPCAITSGSIWAPTTCGASCSPTTRSRTCWARIACAISPSRSRRWSRTRPPTRRTAAPAARRRCSPWTAPSTASRASSASTRPRSGAATI